MSGGKDADSQPQSPVELVADILGNDPRLGFISNKPADQPSLPSPISSAIPVPVPAQISSAMRVAVPVGWVRPTTVVATVPGTVVATVTATVVATVIAVSSAVVPRVAVNDVVLIGRLWLRVVRLIALDNDDRLCIGGCGHRYGHSAQHRTSRERREDYPFHFDTPSV